MLVTLAEIKEFLSINPSNTTDDNRLTSIAKQVSAMVSSYCGREFVAKDRVEYFNGGTSSVFVANPPINAVFSVEGPGMRLNSPSRAGSPVVSNRSPLQVYTVGDAYITTRVKKNGASSLRLENGGQAVIASDESFAFQDEDFTVDVWVRFDSIAGKQEILRSEEGAESWSLGIEDGKMYFFADDGGNPRTEEEDVVFNYRPNRFYRFTVVRKDLALFLYRNGVLVREGSMDRIIEQHDSGVIIEMDGYIDNLYISSKAETFHSNMPPIPDDYTVVSLSFEGTEGSKEIRDTVPTSGDFAFNIDTGEIMFDSSSGELSLSGPTTFGSSPMSVKVSYNGGYTEVPEDMKLATLEMLKIVYKGKTGTETNNMRGENMHSFSLAIDDFPPQVRRILNLYRIVM